MSNLVSNKNLQAGVIGSFLLVAGVFAPLATNTLKGSINLFTFDSTCAILLILCAGMGFVFSLLDRFNLLWIPAVAASILIFLTYWNFGFFTSWFDTAKSSSISQGSLTLMALMVSYHTLHPVGWILLCLGVFGLAFPALDKYYTSTLKPGITKDWDDWN